MADYIVLLRKEEDSDYGVNFPDFPGCATAGKTLEEARQLAGEALRLHIEGMIEDGEEIPEPSTLDEIMKDPENADAVAFLVDTPMPRSVRVNITIREDELKRIDAAAAKAGLSRSGFLAKAALQKAEETAA